MTDIEKVIKGLYACSHGANYHECPYTCLCGYADDWPNELMIDALALLKDPNRIKVVRCKDCCYFEPSNAEEGDNSGYCRNDYAPCQNQTVDAWWFCGSAERVNE